MKRYIKIWKMMTLNSFQTIIASRFGMVFFIFGKIFRFVVYLGFIYFLFSGTTTILGYEKYQTLLFLLTFTVLGQTGQMFFREIYRFRGKLISGEFDFDLVKPVHPLLRNLAGGFDLMDLMVSPLFIITLIYVITNLQFTLFELILYLLLSLNSLVIMAAIHVAVAGFGVITAEVDNLVLAYRDVETMGRFPVDIYKEPLRQILTFAIPVGLMFTIPSKALLGLLSWQTILIAFTLGGISLILAFKFWNFAVQKYSSASS